MFDLIVVTVLSVGLVSLLIGLVVLAVKQQSDSMTAPTARANAMLTKISPYRETSLPEPSLVRVEAKPVVKPRI